MLKECCIKVTAPCARADRRARKCPDPHSLSRRFLPEHVDQVDLANERSQTPSGRMWFVRVIEERVGHEHFATATLLHPRNGEVQAVLQLTAAAEYEDRRSCVPPRARIFGAIFPDNAVVLKSDPVALFGFLAGALTEVFVDEFLRRETGRDLDLRRRVGDAGAF